MYSVRTHRRRIAGCAATVLAVTLGAGSLTVPAATAAPSPAASTEDGIVEVPTHSTIVTGGAAGFISTNDYRRDSRVWIRYEDGVRTTLGSHMAENHLAGDTVLECGTTDATVRNLATDTAFTVAKSGQCVGLAGGAAFTELRSGGSSTLRMHTRAEGSREVTGLPAGATDMQVKHGNAVHGLLQYLADGVLHRAVIDLATATVTEDRAAPLADRWTFEVALSPTRIAWTETDPTSRKAYLVVHTLGSDEKETFPVATSRPQVEFLGDWLVHATSYGADTLAPSQDHALNFRNLRTGATATLLDHVKDVVATTDGDLLVSGGKLGTGDGVFRVSLGQDGTPTADFIAASGYPAGLAEVHESQLPPTAVDFDKTRRVPFTQYFNHQGVKFTETIRHVRTGKTFRYTQDGFFEAGDEGYYPHGFWMGLDWYGQLDAANPADPKATVAAYNGAYTWETTAESGAGFGPAIKRSGTFTVTRAPKQHDFDDNGSPDLLARDASGVLSTPDAGKIGGGWQIYNRIEAAGDIAGSTHADIVARDASGVLWLYQGNGVGGFAGRVKVGGGWQIYDKLTGGSDFTGDGRPDLLAADRSGVLYLYRATGNVSAPFAARKRIGSGWGVYNQLTATGNIAGAGAGDLVARDKDGVLWLYLGKGDGTFTGRTRVTAGWGRYGELIGSGDYDNDGKNDLLAHEPATKTVYHFPGTGLRATPFAGRKATTDFKGGSYNHFG
ncbi:FG-GAP repeat domain-containing protein [Streptomyces pristinaespiralis]|uniref:FG-GAP repeat domain-containing protein n=1 Tax=Streptomyces pristinaespiralis TaxID=38300 RepID=UPI003835B9F8